MALNAIDEALALTGGLLNGNVALAEGVMEKLVDN
jgi:hypothetical protein